MTTETMRLVPEDKLQGKHVIDPGDVSSGSGPYTYACAVCRQPVVQSTDVVLADVVMRCPHCGAYNEANEPNLESAW